MSAFERAIAAYQQARASWADRDRETNAAYKEATGHELPENVSYTDDEGNQWCINVHAELRLVKRGNEDGE